MEIKKEHGCDSYKFWGINVNLPGVKSFDQEMYKYEEIEKTKVLLEGYWKNRHFVIGKNKFCEPVLYVEVKKDDICYEEGIGDDYYGKAYWLPESERGNRMYTGWDHGHAGDYSPYEAYKYGMVDGYKWPLTEMLMEIADKVAYLDHLYEIECAENEVQMDD